MRGPIPFKRVDHWRFLDLGKPPTPVESQLKRTFERVFAHAQFSKDYTCLAREQASFYERHRSLPNEELGQALIGRCGAAGASASKSLTYYSDGTILDSPLSTEVLNDIAQQITADLSDFTVFGITARYDGPNMLVWLETGSPGATMHVGEPDAELNVEVKGEVFGAHTKARAIINQGNVGTADCASDKDVPWPKYAFTCPMAPGDDEAWIALIANAGDNDVDTPLLDLPARRPEWVAPSEYHRHQFSLPAQVDTGNGLAMRLNELRDKAGRKPLHFAAEQSAYLQPIYQREFELNAHGNWKEGSFLGNVLRGDRVGGPVAWSRLASGIAFDGDASDWLAYRMMLPVSRNTLMAPSVDELAIATHGDKAVGFGAVAVVYELLTPGRETALGDVLADGIAKARKGRPTKRLDNPPELADAAREVGDGRATLKELSAVLARANLLWKGPEHIAGIFVPLGDWEPDLAELSPLLEAKALRFGVLVTHIAEPPYGWASPVALVWFLTPQRWEQQQAARQVVPARVSLFVPQGRRARLSP